MLNQVKDKLKAAIDRLGPYTGIYSMAVLSILLLVSCVISLITGGNHLLASTFLAIGVWLIYIFVKDSAGIEVRPKMLLLVKAAPGFLFLNLFSHPMLALSKGIASTGGNAGVLYGIGLMFALIAVFIVIGLSVSESGKAFYEKMEQLPIWTGTEKTDEAKLGDIVLCRDKAEVWEMLAGDDEEKDRLGHDTGYVDKLLAKKDKKADIVIPYKDRFLHMLILGPTGSGKTSQILLPLVNQDMQNSDIGITVLEPKGDFAQKAAMMAKHYGRPFTYFDPSLKDCPHFNPLSGRESDVIENIVTTFRMLNPDSATYFQDVGEQLMRNSLKVLKRIDKDCGVEGEYANLITLSRLLQNSGGAGREIVKKLTTVVSSTPEEAKENADIVSWFQNDYFAERSKIYENTSGIRAQVSKITSNKLLREVLNPIPSNGDKNEVDFDRHLAEGGVMCISTAQGALRDLSRFLGYFIILQFQSAVFRRPGTEFTRRAHGLYIDEFQTYSTPGFSDMLTQGRSYRVASHLSTQARDQMAMGSGKDGKNFVNLVSTNARNIVLFPGCNNDDAKYYSEYFGEYEKVERMVGVSRRRFNPFLGGFEKLGYPTESIRVQKKMTARFTTTSIRYQPFGEIICCTIKNNTVQPPKSGLISYIPKELNEKLDAMIDEYMSGKTLSEDDDFVDKFPLPEFDTESPENSDIVLPPDEPLVFHDGLDEDSNPMRFDDMKPQNRHESQPTHQPEPDKPREEEDLLTQSLWDDDYKDPFDGIVNGDDKDD